MSAPDPHIPGWQILYILIVSGIAVVACAFFLGAILTGQLIFLVPALIVGGFGVVAVLPQGDR